MFGTQRHKSFRMSLAIGLLMILCGGFPAKGDIFDNSGNLIPGTEGITPESFVNLYGFNLTNANLSNVSLSHANLGHATLTIANLSNTILLSATMTSTNLTGANLTRATCPM